MKPVCAAWQCPMAPEFSDTIASRYLQAIHGCSTGASTSIVAPHKATGSKIIDLPSVHCRTKIQNTDRPAITAPDLTWGGVAGPFKNSEPRSTPRAVRVLVPSCCLQQLNLSNQNEQSSVAGWWQVAGKGKTIQHLCSDG